jgi:hypothetical protein
LRRATAGKHAYVGRRSDDGDGLDGRGAQRQLAVGILEQNRALLRHAPRHFEAAKDVDHLGGRPVVKEPDREFGPQNAVDHLVEARHGHFAALHGLLERIREIGIARHLDVESGEGRFHRAVRRAPIRQDESFETGGLLQDLAQNVSVLAGPVAVDLVVRAHHRGNIRILDSDSKRQQIGFPHDPLERCMAIHCSAGTALGLDQGNGITEIAGEEIDLLPGGAPGVVWKLG